MTRSPVPPLADVVLMADDGTLFRVQRPVTTRERAESHRNGTARPARPPTLRPGPTRRRRRRRR